jgi:hypothetical protein
MLVKKKLILLIAASLLWFACKARNPDDASDVKFYGYDNQRFQLQFENYFLIPVTTDDKKILDEAFLSLKFLFGVFQWHNEFIANKGIPHKNPAITILGKEVITIDGAEKLKVKYRFDDFVVLSKDLKKSTVEFWMPKERSTIYQTGMGDAPAEATETNPPTAKKQKTSVQTIAITPKEIFGTSGIPIKKAARLRSKKA